MIMICMYVCIVYVCDICMYLVVGAYEYEIAWHVHDYALCIGVCMYIYMYRCMSKCQGHT